MKLQRDLRNISFKIASCGLFGGILFTLHELGPRVFSWNCLPLTLPDLGPLPDPIKFPFHFLNPYLLLVTATRLGQSRRDSWIILLITLGVLQIGGTIYTPALPRSMIPPILWPPSRAVLPGWPLR